MFSFPVYSSIANMPHEDFSKAIDGNFSDWNEWSYQLVNIDLLESKCLAFC